MTFKEIQDAVILDRFSETQRAAIKHAINSRYGRVWSLEPWTFKRAIIVHPLPSAADEFQLSEVGLQKVQTIWTDVTGSSLTRLTGERPEFAHNFSSTVAGRTAGFTLVGSTVYLDRPLAVATDLTILGELAWTPLVADADVPLLPLEYHWALVAGGAADMLLREADPTWQGEEKSSTDQVNEMRLSYLGNQPMAQTAYPSWPY